MSRELTTAMQAAIDAPVIRPVALAYLDIASDPIAMWTGPGSFQPTGSPDGVLNGKTFLPSAAFADMSEIQEDEGIGGPVTIVLQGSSLDEPALRQFVRDRRQWRGRRAYIWLGYLNENLYAVHEWPVRIKTALMVDVKVRRGVDDVSIQLVIDEDLGRAKTAAWRITDHARIHPTDTFSSFVTDLANKPNGLERPRSTPGFTEYEMSEAWRRDNQWNQW
jgi:hypothetical protein